MKPKNLIALAAVTAVVLVAAVVTSKKSGAAAAPADASSGPLFEGLTARLNDVASLEVTQGGKTVTIEKKGTEWAIQNANGYPAKFETVKKALIALAELELAEAKTSDPSRYAELGVEDPAEGDDSSTLVVLEDDRGAVLASLVVGDSKPGRSPELYARKTDEARAWKVRGRVELDTDPKSWMDPQVANVASDRTKEVTVTRADGERLHVYKANRTDSNFLVEGVPADRELSSPTIANPLGGVLSNLALDEVRPVGEIDFEAAPVSTTELETWDGLVVVAKMAEHEGMKWVTFEARYEAPPVTAEETPPSEEGDGGDEDAVEPAPVPEHDEDAIKTEVLQLNADLSPWAFRFPSYKQSNFEKRLADLLKQPMPAATPENGEVLGDGEDGVVVDPDVVHDESDGEHDHSEHDHSQDGIKSDG